MLSSFHAANVSVPRVSQLFALSRGAAIFALFVQRVGSGSAWGNALQTCPLLLIMMNKTGKREKQTSTHKNNFRLPIQLARRARLSPDGDERKKKKKKEEKRKNERER